MKSVGVREFHQNTSVYLRMVTAGESLQVTDRGRPVAMVTAIPNDETRVQRMVREGRAAIATTDLLDLADELEAEALEPAGSGPTLSQVLAEMRADERY